MTSTELDDASDTTREAHGRRFKRVKVNGDSGKDYCNATTRSGADQINGQDKGNVAEKEDLRVTMDLGDDLLHLVFSFLGQINLCRASLVCRQWRAVSNWEDLWTCLNIDKQRISIEQFTNLCLRHPNATSVNFFATPNMAWLVRKAICSLRNLEAVTLRKGGLLNCSFFKALEDCSMLKTLVINDAKISVLPEIFISHKRLRHLHIIGCQFAARLLSIRCLQLEILYLTRSTMPKVKLHCPLLRDLDIGSCLKLKKPATQFARNCHLLESLDMSNSCSSDTTLNELSRTFTNLRSLSASFVSLQAAKLPLLTVLKLHECHGLASVSAASMAHCSMLEVLELNSCEILTSLSLDLPRLSTISFSHCPKFVDLNLQTLKLTSFAVSDCLLLHRINITSDSLKNLEFRDQANLATLDLQCESLQKLNILDCDHMERASISSIALRSLNLGVCPKMNKVKVKAPNMVEIELKGCGVLSQTYFDCPLLTSLDASFCRQFSDECLSAITAACPLIESIMLTSCHSVSSKGIYSLRMLHCLTSLDLSYTLLEDLHTIFQSCPQLKVLILQACRHLKKASLEPLYKEDALPSLRELDLSHGNLSQSSIEELLANCTRLTHVSLKGCLNVHDLNWDYGGKNRHSPSELPFVNSYNIIDPIEQPSRQLKNLNCVCCENMRKVLISPFGNCYFLSSLTLSLSQNLKEVCITSQSLSLLNLSKCCSLQILRLHCSKLSSLTLSSCLLEEDVIRDAITGCEMLEMLDVQRCPKVSFMSIGKFRAVCPTLKCIHNSIAPPRDGSRGKRSRPTPKNT